MDLKTVVDEWLRLDADPHSRREVQQMLQSDPQRLQKMMAPRIAFGTAGLRAEMAPGFAQMNVVTVRQASQGLAVYVGNEVADAKSRGIVIGHDHRHHSAEFARATALTFAKRGFKVHYLGQVHTPMVPFGITQLNAACGVCVTASHNPAQDNGFKVYWENACQIIAPHDTGIAEQIDAHLDLWDLSETEFEVVDLFPAYAKLVLQPLVGDVDLSRLGPVVYTPMHGVGWQPAQTCFKMLGLDARVVPEQQEPDADFPSVKFPNPEEKGALDLAMAHADRLHANVVLANDPDADRFSCAVKEHGSWKQLTGDQIGILFANYILSRARDGKIAVINSAVSSQQLQRVAELAGVEYFETLTGFKWLGNRAIDLAAEGYVVPLAYEEAIGYMVSDVIRDKDGISALHLFAQLVGELYAAGKTLFGEFDSISEKTGYYATHNSYYVVSSPQVTTDTFKDIRTRPFPKYTKIGDLQITAWRDLTTGYDSRTPDHKPVLPVSPSSEMLTVFLKFPDGSTTSRVTARGSGTEPKLKVYIEAAASSEGAAQRAADYVWDLLGTEWFGHIKKN